VAVVRRRLDVRQIASLPTREQINLPVQEQLIVELYSK
jgi:ribosomal protein S4